MPADAEPSQPGDAALNEPLLQVSDLRTWFFTDAGVVRAVDGVSFTLNRGETLGIVGESGSGKSVAAKSIMNLLEEPARIVAGSIRFRGQEITALSEDELRDIRGAEIAMVFQDPMTSLNPVLRISRQLIETMTAHRPLHPGRGTHPGGVAAGPHGHCRAGTGAGFLAAPVLRRHAPARDAGDGLRQRTVADPGRRTDHRAGRDDPGADPRPAARAERRSRHRGHPDQPRPRRDRNDLLARAGDVCRRGGGGRPPAGPADRSAPSLHLGAAARRAAASTATAGDRRLATIEGQPPDARAWPEGCRFRARCPFAIDACARTSGAAADRRRPQRPLLGDAGRRAHCVPPPPRTADAAASRPDAAPAPLLDVQGLVKHFPLPRENFLEQHRVLRAVDGVDLRSVPRRNRRAGRRIRLRQIDAGARW